MNKRAPWKADVSCRPGVAFCWLTSFVKMRTVAMCGSLGPIALDTIFGVDCCHPDYCYLSSLGLKFASTAGRLLCAADE